MNAAPAPAQHAALTLGNLFPLWGNQSLPLCVIDLETRNMLPISVGPHRYAEHPTADVIVMRYAFVPRTGRPGLTEADCGEWWWGHPCPADLRQHVEAGGVLVAHNAEFERCLWSKVLVPRYGFPTVEYEQWECTAAMAAALSLPRSLEKVAPALGLPIAKDDEGRRVMLKTCKPRAPRVGEDASLVYWVEDPDTLARLSKYCAWDVLVTAAAYPIMRQLDPAERESWLLDARMNDRGVTVDLDSVKACQALVDKTEKVLSAELRRVTGGAVRTAKQVSAFMRWLEGRGHPLSSLQKATIAEALKDDDAARAAGGPALPPDVRRALEIRAELALSSTGKLASMEARRCADGRAKGNLMWHGAGTGRWAGVGIQVQNMPRGSLPKGVKPADVLAMVRWALAVGNVEAIRMLGTTPLAGVSSVLRSLLVASPGFELIAADYANIEGRVLAWLAGEAWKVKAFADYDAGTGWDLYALAYAKSFGVSPADVMHNKDHGDGSMRQIGKVQELALGYQGGKGAFQSMAQIYGIEVTDDRAEEIKWAWRDAHPATVRHWYDLEEAASAAVRAPGVVFRAGRVAYVVSAGFLWCRLPSGRLLAYRSPWLAMKDTPVGSREVIHFMGISGYTKKWSVQTTYGGKLCENNTQATARDVMRDGIKRVAYAGYPVLFTVHDELIAEAPQGTADLGAFTRAMTAPSPWSVGLPVKASGWIGTRYRKD